MMLKQARAMTYDRVHELVIQNADPCDHPPFSSSDTLNAYAIYSLKCSVLFLGMAKRPWLDAQYDDASIASRGGMVIAHELAHMTLRTTYVEPDYSGLLGYYRQSTYSEAIADVGAALGVIKTGLVSMDDLLMHYCSLWCSRLPLGWVPSNTASHPQANERCDFLYSTITNLTALGITLT